MIIYCPKKSVPEIAKQNKGKIIKVEPVEMGWVEMTITEPSRKDYVR